MDCFHINLCFIVYIVLFVFISCYLYIINTERLLSFPDIYNAIYVMQLPTMRQVAVQCLSLRKDEVGNWEDTICNRLLRLESKTDSLSATLNEITRPSLLGSHWDRCKLYNEMSMYM